MDSQIGLVIKVLLLSTLISILIKYGGQFLPIEGTSINALIAILLPALVLGILLVNRKLSE
jgi:hypothetical protein